MGLIFNSTGTENIPLEQQSSLLNGLFTYDQFVPYDLMNS